MASICVQSLEMIALLKTLTGGRVAKGVGLLLGAWLVAQGPSGLAVDAGFTVPISKPSSRAEKELSRTAAPLFKQFCFDCHGGKKSKAGVDLERLVAEPDFARHFKAWEKVIAVLDQNEMPPEDKAQPSQTQRRRLVSALRNGLGEFVRHEAGDPGRVVVRHLTSAEYANTIRDLTDLDLGLERGFVNDAVGGEGFSNVGDTQFIQDSTLERYLEAAKVVASHAVIGTGPLRFYADPGRTGQELSAIHRIEEIYRQHGFRTGSGEGGEAYGLDRYAKAFYVAWRFHYRRELGLGRAVLARLAQEEAVDVRFAEHIWTVLSDPSESVPLSEIKEAWRALPRPTGRGNGLNEAARAGCEALPNLLRDWQTGLAPHPVDLEEDDVLTESSFRPALKGSFRVIVQWPPGMTNVSVVLSVVPTAEKVAAKATIVWRQPRVRFRQPGRRLAEIMPLEPILSRQSAQQLEFGKGVNGKAIDAADFVTTGRVLLPIDFTVPTGATQAEFLVETQLDIEHGDDSPVRCLISGRAVGVNQQSSASGARSVVLSNPNSPESAAWSAGVSEFARKLPQISHREAAPADKDPIPAPFDNRYNSAERNSFHSQIKYHRDDRFLTEHILDDATRARLDGAWVDLLTSFDFHDTFLRFVARKFKLNLGDDGVRNLSQEGIDRIPEGPRQFFKTLHEHYISTQQKLKAAEPEHIQDVLQFAQLAWRRPLSDQEARRLRSLYSNLREDAKLDHPDAIRSVLGRILVSPEFLYRVESPGLLAGSDRGPRGGGRVALSDHELASRLSYFLWSSMPDADLRRAADSGELRKPEQLARQAKRMLQDPKARRFATEFFGQWFGFYRFDGHRGVDAERFTEFTDTLKSAMHDEAVSFFEHIIREDRPVQDILFANYSFLNRELAQHYGIDATAVSTNQSTDSHVRRISERRTKPADKAVRIPSDLAHDPNASGEPAWVLSTNALERVTGVNQFNRGGLLGLGAVLTVTSAPLRTSAVKRGDWILRRILGTPVPPPPGDAGSIPADDVLSDHHTVRERLEVHRRDPSCAACHARIDPLGFALEHFDSIGRWRENYRDGQSIDASGTLNTGVRIEGLDGLQRYLRSQESAFHRTLCVKLLGYALGRGELVSDRPLIDRMRTSLQKENRFGNLVAQVVTSTQFRFLRGSDIDSPSPRGDTPSVK